MGKKIGIIGIAQSHHQYDMPKTREDMVFEVAKAALADAGILREELGTVITSSTDFLDGRTISNVFLSMAVGAFLKDESKVEEDGTNSLFYAMMKLMTGTYDVALVEAHTQAWTFNPHQVSFYTVDPLQDRQFGMLNDISASAIQAKMYMDKYGAGEEDLARVAVKNLSNAAINPFAHRRMADVSIGEVLNSKMYYSPIRELMFSPISDGAAVVILASEDKAREVCCDPVWIEGIGTCQDAYLRDRNLLSLDSLKKAADSAYKMAGITDPYAELDLLEVTERFAHEELMIYEALGIAREGKGKYLLEKGVTARCGELPVNPSGGALGADPVCATGLVRVVEAVKQIRGEADGHQIAGARRALAHGQFGICAQKNTVIILGGE